VEIKCGKEVASICRNGRKKIRPDII